MTEEHSIVQNPKPKDGDAFLDIRMRPARVRMFDKKSGEWLTEDEYLYRKHKRKVGEKHVQFRKQ